MFLFLFLIFSLVPELNNTDSCVSFILISAFAVKSSLLMTGQLHRFNMQLSVKGHAKYFVISMALPLFTMSCLVMQSQVSNMLSCFVLFGINFYGCFLIWFYCHRRKWSIDMDFFGVEISSLSIICGHFLVRASHVLEKNTFSLSVGWKFSIHLLDSRCWFHCSNFLYFNNTLSAYI